MMGTKKNQPNPTQTYQKTYPYDIHIDPSLQFDRSRHYIEEQLDAIIEQGIQSNNPDDAKHALQKIRQMQSPYLNWAGKAEHTCIEIPTITLHTQEQLDPIHILDAVRKSPDSNPEQPSLFPSVKKKIPKANLLSYKHNATWMNRFIAGDSLLVMNSLLEKEGFTGKVQMIYIDPPYGIRYGSNFQPFIQKRDVQDGNDADLTQEPEMIKAFRDTWELGIHSYLTYLRDRIYLARELLAETGSCFIQISDENIHYIKNIMEELFGRANFISHIMFQKTVYQDTRYLAGVADHILWYAKNKQHVKVNKLFRLRNNAEISAGFNKLELEDGTITSVAKAKTIPKHARFFRASSLISKGESKEGNKPYEFEGKMYYPKPGNHWKTKNPENLDKLAAENRLIAYGNTLCFKKYEDDFPVSPLTNFWNDTLQSTFAYENKYVVQTYSKVIQRCILMSTDPGDLVFDPTCGSGTTAFCAEQWGRKWIACDTSRIAIAIAKQRLLTAKFDYYQLAKPEEGVSAGFIYKTVPHITLKSLVKEDISTYETLYDQPKIKPDTCRITGPFTVEAVPSPVVLPISNEDNQTYGNKKHTIIPQSRIAQRQQEWQDELYKTGIRGKQNQHIDFSRLEPLTGYQWLHAEAETTDKASKKAVISFGQEFSLLQKDQVEEAIQEAISMNPNPQLLIFASFQFSPEARHHIENTQVSNMLLLEVQMNADLLTEDLKKKRASNESFWLVGQPDVKLSILETGEYKGMYQLEIVGFDYYNTKTGMITSGKPKNIAMWMVDTNYNGVLLYPDQVFFPMAGDKDGWTKLARNLKATIDTSLITAYHGTKSLPFKLGNHNTLAVKIMDDRGIESLKVFDLNPSG